MAEVFEVNIGSDNGLVLRGNKPLPKPMLTQFCHHLALQGPHESIIFQSMFLSKLFMRIS